MVLALLGGVVPNDALGHGRAADSALARATAVAGPLGDEHAEARGDDIEALGHIFADDMHWLRAARAGGARWRDDLLDPLEMRGQRAAIGAAWLRISPARDRSLGRRLHPRERLVEILQRQVELLGVELLRSCAETVALEGSDDRGKPRDLGLGIGIGGSQPLDLAAQRRGFVSIVGSGGRVVEHEPHRIRIARRRP